jgi:hypothetical protein
MIVFGGADNDYMGDVWALSLSGNPTWTRLFPSGGPPGPRGFHSAIYDPVGDRMIVYGGANHLEVLRDAWAPVLSGAPVWSALPAGAPRRHDHAAL